MKEKRNSLFSVFLMYNLFSVAITQEEKKTESLNDHFEKNEFIGGDPFPIAGWWGDQVKFCLYLIPYKVYQGRLAKAILFLYDEI